MANGTGESGESGLNVLDETKGTGSAPGTGVTSDTLQVLGAPSVSGSGTIGERPLTDSQVRRDAGKGPPVKQQTELERLQEWSEKIKHRIAILKPESAGAEAISEQPSPVANRPATVHHGPPATAEQFLQLLERSGLLNPERLEVARNLNDAKTLARKLIAGKVLTHWQASQLISGRSSFLLGNYMLFELVSADSMGAVFLAEHTTMGRRVTVRVISEEISNDRRLLERFLDEARTLAEVEHPNIIRAYNVDQARDRYYLVMEHVNGHNLEKIVQEQGPLDCNLAADYIRQAAEGLHHGHENDFIHGNVKPSNLLLDRSGVVKILNLGLSGLQESARPGGNNADNKHMVDSIDYISPEYAFGSMDIDRRADIYSLGCTLYFLLTGQPPFPEGPLFEKLMKHQSAEPQSIRDLRAEVPAALEEVCGNMMAKKPEDRYATALMVAKKLALYLADSGQ